MIRSIGQWFYLILYCKNRIAFLLVICNQQMVLEMTIAVDTMDPMSCVLSLFSLWQYIFCQIPNRLWHMVRVIPSNQASTVVAKENYNLKFSDCWTIWTRITNQHTWRPLARITSTSRWPFCWHIDNWISPNDDAPNTWRPTNWPGPKPSMKSANGPPSVPRNDGDHLIQYFHIALQLFCHTK